MQTMSFNVLLSCKHTYNVCGEFVFEWMPERIGRHNFVVLFLSSFGCVSVCKWFLIIIECNARWQTSNKWEWRCVSLSVIRLFIFLLTIIYSQPWAYPDTMDTICSNSVLLCLVSNVKTAAAVSVRMSSILMSTARQSVSFVRVDRVTY